MARRVEFSPNADKELDTFDPPVARRILKFLYERVATLDDPRSIDEPLKGGKLGDFWKYCVGDYRIISSIEDGNFRILVLQEGNRREVYKKWSPSLAQITLAVAHKSIGFLQRCQARPQ